MISLLEALFRDFAFRASRPVFCLAAFRRGACLAFPSIKRKKREKQRTVFLMAPSSTMSAMVYTQQPTCSLTSSEN